MHARRLSKRSTGFVTSAQTAFEHRIFFERRKEKLNTAQYLGIYRPALAASAWRDTKCHNQQPASPPARQLCIRKDVSKAIVPKERACLLNAIHVATAFNPFNA